MISSGLTELLTGLILVGCSEFLCMYSMSFLKLNGEMLMKWLLDLFKQQFFVL